MYSLITSICSLAVCKISSLSVLLFALKIRVMRSNTSFFNVFPIVYLYYLLKCLVSSNNCNNKS